MGLKLYEETSVQAIADAIRAKNGSSDTYTISEMSTAIGNIPSGGTVIPTIKLESTITITAEVV